MGVCETTPDDTDPWARLQELGEAYREAESRGSRVRAKALRHEWIALRRQLCLETDDEESPSDPPPR